MCGNSRSDLYLIYYGLFIFLCFSSSNCKVLMPTDHPNCESRKMAIIGPGKPTPEFTNDFADSLRRTLTSVMDEGTDDEQIPLLDEFQLTEQKYISVVCVNEFSKQWLIDIVEALSPFEETSLLVVEEKDVPALHHFFVYLPYADYTDQDNVLKRIKRSTPNLKTECWKIRGIVPDTPWSRGSVGKFDIDTASMRLIEEMNYSVYVGMGRAYFWDFENKKGTPQAELLRGHYWEENW